MGEFLELQEAKSRGMIRPSGGPDRESVRLALGEYRHYWVVPASVLAYLAQWAAPRPVKAHPSDDLRRLALGAATALSEAIQRLETQSGAPWDRALPIEVSDLALWMGVGVAQAQKGLDWLELVGITRRDQRGWVQIDEPLWVSAPVLASIAWDSIRERLQEGRASLAPELALVRALALRTPLEPSSVRERESSGWCSLSYAELAEATLFKRSAVLNGMAALQAAHILEQEERSGRRGRWRLMPAAFGRGESVAKTMTESRDEGSTIMVQDSLPLKTDSSSLSGETRNEAREIPLHVAGLSLMLPPGTHVRVVVDELGRRSYHVGDDLVIGPVE